MQKPLITVVEMPVFIKRVAGLLSDSDREALVVFLAGNPDAGAVVPGTGGIRKLRWAAKGKGKSGGVRVIYFVGGEIRPIFLLTVYGKGQKGDLSGAERAEFKQTIRLLG